CANLEGANFDGHALFPGLMIWERTYSKEDKDKEGWYKSVDPVIRQKAEIGAPHKFLQVDVRPSRFIKANLRQARFEKMQFFELSNSPVMATSLRNWVGRGVVRGANQQLDNIAIQQGNLNDYVFLSGAELSTALSKLNVDDERRKEIADAIEMFQRQMRA